MLLLWQFIAVRQHDPRLFPTLRSILTSSLPSLGVFSNSGTEGIPQALSALASNGLITIGRITCGFALGAPLGIAFGVLMHSLRGSGRISALPLLAVRSVPLLALIPLFSFWFGSSPLGLIVYIAFGVFVVTASDAFEASANMPPNLIQLAALLGARKQFLLRTVYLPGISRPMATSLRNAIGLTWALSLGAEYISATSGLGYITYQSYLYTDMGKLAVLCSVYVLLGYFSYEVSQRCISWLLGWGA